jgi:hypothetical protein
MTNPAPISLCAAGFRIDVHALKNIERIGSIVQRDIPRRQAFAPS